MTKNSREQKSTEVSRQNFRYQETLGVGKKDGLPGTAPTERNGDIAAHKG